MPTSGNTLGVRRYYQYTTDGGENYKYLTDETLGGAMGATLNDTNPNLPKRFKPRVVYIQGTVAGQTVRKALIAPTVDNTTYAAEASTVVTIDGINFGTTGRRGEQFSFGRNPTGVVAP